MNARKSSVSVVYEGTNISSTLENYLTSFSFAEVAGGGSDSIKINLSDRSGRWINGWFPSNSDSVSAAITVNDWLCDGDTRKLSCGSFTVDDVSASGEPLQLSIGAVSAPVDKDFSATKRTATWENVTLRYIAETIAAKAGLALVYDGSEINIASEEQNATDSSFLSGLCKDYGFSVKIYNNKIVVFEREAYKQKPAAATIVIGDMLSWSYNESLQGTYTGVKYSYTDPIGGEDIEYIYGDESRLLSANIKADSLADAERKAKAALNAENHSATTMSVKTMGNPSLVAGTNVKIVGIGKPDGKYYIDSITHALGNGYTTTLSLSKVV